MKKKLVISIILIISVIVLIGISIFLIFGKKSDELLYSSIEAGIIVNHTYIYSDGRVVEIHNFGEEEIVKRLNRFEIYKLEELIEKVENQNISPEISSPNGYSECVYRNGEKIVLGAGAFLSGEKNDSESAKELRKYISELLNKGVKENLKINY